ncbi:MAG: MoaD/ThiS family protein [Ktedonobacterales bacterium]
MNRVVAEAAVTVLLPDGLRARAGGARTVTLRAATLRGVIAALDHEHPGLRFNLCHETGELRPFVNVFINGVNVRYLQGLDTPIPAGATVYIMPSVAGG